MKIGQRNKSIYLQRVVLSNSLKRKNIDKKLYDRINSKKVDLSHSLEKNVSKNIDQEKVQKYFFEKFKKPIDAISKKLNGGNVSQIRFITELTTSILSEKRLIKFLQKYGVISSDINSFEDIEITLEKIFTSEISTLITPDHIVDILKVLSDASDAYSNLMFESLMEANKFYLDQLYDADNYSNRLELFDSLYDIEAIRGGIYKTYYECTNCNVGVFSGNMTLNVTPSKVKLKCPNCKKEVFYLAPYFLDDEIYKGIQHKDGLLFLAISYLFEENRISYSSNYVVQPNTELDFILLNKRNQVTDVIEVKMHKTNRPSDTEITNIKTSITQLLKTRDRLIEHDPSFTQIRYHLVTNNNSESVLSKAKNEYNALGSGVNLIIHTPEQFYKYVSQNVSR